MKNIKSMRRQLLLIPLVLLSCLLLFTACDGSKTPAVTSITIQTNDKPQTVFVKGQNLDLSAGKLTVTRDDGTTETIAMNDPNVTISGYDMNTVGDQNLVITYGEKSVNLTVSVVNRMTFSGFESQYFVGDVFDTTKGSVTIVKDDGSKINVRLNDTSVISVVSFDSSSAGTKQVGIRYVSGSDDYTDYLNVQVYNVGNIKFIKPTRTAYGSHETEMSFSGGYFQVTAEGNESLTKFVELTKDMISGFNPGAATKDHISTPLKQAVMINYAGQNYQFDISITYSGVSMMHDAIKELKNVNLDVENPQVTEKQGKIALDALQAYMKLTPAERSNISHNDCVLVARVAAMYGNAYANIMAKPFSDAVLIEDGNVALLNTATRDAVDKAIIMLSDPKNEFVTFTLFLEEFAAEFAKVEVVDGETVADKIKFVSEDTLNYVISVLEYMVKLHDDMADVPDAWTVEDLESYATDIEAAVRHIRNFENAGLMPIAVDIVSSWRKNHDYLRIIYTYYYNYTPEKIVETLWNRVPLPGELQTLYNYMAQAARQASIMSQYGLNALWYDTSMFHYYYNKSIEKSKEIMAGDDTLCKELYEYIDLDNVFKNQLTLASVGFVNLSTSMNGDPQYTSLLNKFLSLMELYTDASKGISFDENKDLLQALMDEYVAMSPAKQRAFLNAMHYLYGQEKVKDNMLFQYIQEDGKKEVKGYFIFFLVNYFEHQLPDSADPILQDLLLAIEYYQNNGIYEDGMSNFLTKMEAVILAYGTLNKADQNVFDEYLGNAYEKYKKLYQINKAGTPSDLSKFEAKRDELIQALADYDTLRENLSNEEGKINEGMIGALMCAYERIQYIVNELRNSDDEQLRTLVSTLPVSFSEDSSLPIDYAAQNVRWDFIIMMHNITFTVTHDDETQEKVFGWDLYAPYENVPFHAKAYYVIMQQYNGGTEFDAAKVLEAMSYFRAQIDKQANALQCFYNFDGDFYYNAGLKSFFAKVLTEGNAALGTKLLEVEDLYSKYARSEKEEDKTAFMNAMAEAIALFASITDTENFNTYLADMYNFYLAKYNALNTAA